MPDGTVYLYRITELNGISVPSVSGLQWGVGRALINVYKSSEIPDWEPFDEPNKYMRENDVAALTAEASNYVFKDPDDYHVTVKVDGRNCRVFLEGDRVELYLPDDNTWLTADCGLEGLCVKPVCGLDYDEFKDFIVRTRDSGIGHDGFIILNKYSRAEPTDRVCPAHYVRYANKFDVEFMDGHFEADLDGIKVESDLDDKYGEYTGVGEVYVSAAQSASIVAGFAESVLTLRSGRPRYKKFKADAPSRWSRELFALTVYDVLNILGGGIGKETVEEFCFDVDDQKACESDHSLQYGEN
jgi:hypothetical protein